MTMPLSGQGGRAIDTQDRRATLPRKLPEADGRETCQLGYGEAGFRGDVAIPFKKARRRGRESVQKEAAANEKTPPTLLWEGREKD